MKEPGYDFARRRERSRKRLEEKRLFHVIHVFFDRNVTERYPIYAEVQ